MDIKQLPGVTVSLWIKRGDQYEEIGVDAEGCLFVNFEQEMAAARSLLPLKDKGKETVKIIFRVTHSRSDVYGFQADGKKNVELAHNHGTVDYRDYRRMLVIKRSQRDERILHTEYTDNNLRLIEFSRGDTQVTTYEVCLISQPLYIGGKLVNRFYLCAQRMYEANLYRGDLGDDTLCCPVFQDSLVDDENWHRLVDLLSDLVEDRIGLDNLPSVDTYVSAANSVDLSGLPHNGAVVKWFNFANGTGCLQLADGRTVSVHWKEAPRHPGQNRRYLLPGERVVFGAIEPRHNTKGRPSKFTHQAVATHLLSQEVALAS